MKKIFLILLILLTLGLVSCDSKSENLNSYEKITPKMIDANLTEDRYSSNRINKIYETTYKEDSDYTVDISNSNNGIIVYKSTSEIRFYSLISGEFIGTDPYFVSNTQYKIFSDVYIGFYLYVYDSNFGRYDYYDSYGNRLAYGDGIYNPNACSITTEYDYVGIEKRVFKINVTQTLDEVITKSYTYTNDNMLILITEEEESYTGPIKGDGYIDIDKISSKHLLGKEGYYFTISENNYIIYDQSGKVINNYILPNMNKGIVVDNYIYWQETHLLLDDAENYDYFIGDSKYSLKSFKFDLINNKYEEVKLDYLIASYIKPYYDKNNNPSYAIAEVNRIGDDKYVSNYDSEEVLIGKDGKIITSTLGLFLQSYIKLNNGNYYNFENGIIYDAKLKPITCLKAISPTYIRGIGFICIKDGKYGLIDESGNVLLEFIYNSIGTTVYSNNIMIMSDKYVYKYNTVSTNKEQICKIENYVSFGKVFYGVKHNDDTCTLYSLKDEISSLEYTENKYNNLNTIFGNYVIIINHNYEEYDIYKYLVE